MRVRGAVAALCFEVVEELADQRRVQVAEVQVGGLLAGVAGGEGEQQPPGVAVGGDGVRAGVALAGQPVGEERLQGRSERGHGRSRRWSSSRCPARASSSGRRGQVPVGGAWVDVAEVGGQQGEPGLPVLAGGVGIEQAADRERMTQIVDARAAGRRPGLQPGLAGQPRERRVHVAIQQPGAGRGDEHRRGAGMGVQPVPQPQVAAQRLGRGRVQRHQPGLAELGLADGQHAAAGEVERRRGRGGSPRRPACRSTASRPIRVW